MRRIALLVLAALAAVALATGCGGDDPGKGFTGPVAHESR